MSHMMKLLSAAGIAALAITLTSISLSAQNTKPVPLTQEQFEALAQTPPMGWNSWNKFNQNVSEKLLMDTADAMVASGMKDAGYEYIVVDDCWQVDRDADGNIVCDPVNFPHGMKYVADYIHSKGLKFGIYSCVGTKTCAGRPGSMGHEYQDALFYARTGVDYLKYDFCNNEKTNSLTSYKLMREALKAAGRPIVFSLCEWGSTKPWEWGKGIGHLWRATGDIINKFEGKLNWGGNGVVQIIDLVTNLYPYAGPGHWNDPDMLEVGNGGMTTVEETSHFAMWCMLAAPLIAGNDLSNMTEDVRTILTNKEAIAIDQDPLGVQAHLAIPLGDRQVWLKKLAGDQWAVCFFNRSGEDWNLNFNWTDIAEIRDAHTIFSVRDLWKHKDIGKTNKNIVSVIPSHAVLMVKLTK